MPNVDEKVLTLRKTRTLTTITVQGIGWSGISRFIQLLFQFGITAILARLLTPNDFGLLAMVVVFTSFVTIFRDFGLTAALIQCKGVTEEHLSSSFWINILLGFILALALSFLAPAIAYFYREDRLTLITIALASTFSISSFGIVQTALFTKEMNFKLLAIVTILTVTISGTVAVWLAFSGFGVWSLVWQSIISSSVTVILLWNFSSWRPKILFKWYRVKELLGFGINFTGFSFVNYFSRNLDNLLIGKFLGLSPLGFYNLAYRLLLFPISNISRVIGQVMFPSLSVIQNDKSKVCHAYMKATRYIATVTFPLMIGILIVAPQFIRVIFGPQWERSIFLVQILALVSLIQSIGTLNGIIYQSQGRTDIQFRAGSVFAIIVSFSFIIGLRWSVEGVTVAYAIASLLLIYPSLAIPFRLIDLKVSHFIKQFNTVFLATAGMGILVFLLRLFMENALKESNFIILITTVIVGAISYVSFLFLLDKNLYKDIFQLFKHLKPSSLVVVGQEGCGLREEKL